MNAQPSFSRPNMKSVLGRRSGNSIAMPHADVSPMPALTPPGVLHNGRKAEGFGDIGASLAYPDVRSFRRKFGLVIPATNTSMEHELWGLLFGNQHALRGLGLHTSTVATPTPKLAGEVDLAEYKRQFLGGLKAAVDAALLAQPHYMILGMSLEHIVASLEEIRCPVQEIEAYSGLAWATWHDAVHAALQAYDARRIGILTPFDRTGNEHATRMFEDLGYQVAASVGFSCAHALHIAHVPDWAKEKAILELLAPHRNALDAVVQCGTNMSFIDVAERLEPVIGIPILGINAVTFWYALRENGFEAALDGGGRLLREF